MKKICACIHLSFLSIRQNLNHYFNQHVSGSIFLPLQYTSAFLTLVAQTVNLVLSEIELHTFNQI